MLEILKEIILDFQGQQFPKTVHRHLRYEIVKNKAFVCIGVRRCGKSTLLFQLVEELLKEGVERDNFLYINFFDDRLTELRKGNLSLITEAYFSLYPEKKNSETVYCFFDEIQEVTGWEMFVERLMRTERCKVFISGSSAKMLSKEIATQMRGRSIAWELFPFSFAEFLDFAEVDYRSLTSKSRFTIQKRFEEYWEKGGFAEVFGVSETVRVLIHQEYYRTIVHRDVIERHDALHPQAVVQLSHRLVNSVSSLYTINRLTDFLKSQGYKISKSFVSECMEWFEDAFFLFTVKIFSRSVTKQNVNPKKVYCIDSAFVRSVSSQMFTDRGSLLENLVFLHLRRFTDRISYYRTAHGHEVDFLWLDDRAKRHLVQVCSSLKDTKTRERELRALYEAMTELKETSATLVSAGEEEEIREGTKRIKVIPAWKYFLSL